MNWTPAWTAEEVMWRGPLAGWHIPAFLFFLAITIVPRPAGAAECTVDAAAEPIAAEIVEILEAQSNDDFKVDAKLDGCIFQMNELILKYHCFHPNKTERVISIIDLSGASEARESPVNGRTIIRFAKERSWFDFSQDSSEKPFTRIYEVCDGTTEKDMRGFERGIIVDRKSDGRLEDLFNEYIAQIE